MSEIEKNAPQVRPPKKPAPPGQPARIVPPWRLPESVNRVKRRSLQFLRHKDRELLLKLLREESLSAHLHQQAVEWAKVVEKAVRENGHEPLVGMSVADQTMFGREQPPTPPLGPVRDQALEELLADYLSANPALVEPAPL